MNDFPDIIELNVGGAIVATHLSTLVKDESSMLAAMFSGRHVISRDKDGRYFIDCDCTLFKHILEYLRFGTIPSEEQALDVYGYAEYFGISDLIKALEAFSQVRSVLRKRSYDADFNLDFRLYEELKSKAVKDVDSFYKTENILISITIKHSLENSCPPQLVPCQPIIYSDPKSGLSKSSAETAVAHKIPLSVTTSETHTGWSKHLAFELRELGFSKYSYYLDCEEILRCKRCSRNVGRMEYILLENSPTPAIKKTCWVKP